MSVTAVSGIPLVQVEGDLDVDAAGAFQETLHGITANGLEPVRIIIDLEHCTYIDSAGLGVLFTAAGLARQNEGWVAAVRPSLHVLRILQLVRLTDERGFQVFADLESALAALRAA